MPEERGKLLPPSPSSTWGSQISFLREKDMDLKSLKGLWSYNAELGIESQFYLTPKLMTFRLRWKRKRLTISYSELSALLFGDGNCREPEILSMVQVTFTLPSVGQDLWEFTFPWGQGCRDRRAQGRVGSSSLFSFCWLKHRSHFLDVKKKTQIDCKVILSLCSSGGIPLSSGHSKNYLNTEGGFPPFWFCCCFCFNFCKTFM